MRLKRRLKSLVNEQFRYDLAAEWRIAPEDISAHSRGRGKPAFAKSTDCDWGKGWFPASEPVRKWSVHSRGRGNPVFAKSMDFDLRQRLGPRVRGDERTGERLPLLCDFLTRSFAGYAGNDAEGF